MSSARDRSARGPEPPRTAAIVIACVLGLALLVAVFGLVSLLR